MKIQAIIYGALGSLCVGTIWSQMAFAQVTGTFFPTAVGEIQEPGRTPFPQLTSPSLPVAEQQMGQLESEMNLQRRPYLNFMSSYANQSQVSLPGQLDTFTPQIAEFGFFPTKQSEARFSYIPTIFGTAGLKSPRVFGQEYRVTYNAQPTTRLKLSNRLGLYQTVGSGDKVTGGLNVLGVASANYAINDRAHFTGGFRRDILGSTLLTATGLNLPGTNETVGRVTQNLFFGLLDLRPTRKTYLGLSYGGGFDQGQNVKTNPFQQFGLSISHPIYENDVKSHLSSLNLSYQLLEFNWKYDLSSIGNTVLQLQPQNDANAILKSSLLGQTQIPAASGTRQAGVGGYFSPQAFVINSWGIGGGGHVAGPVYYRGGGGVAIGSSRTSTSGDSSLSPPGFGGFANGALTARLSKHVVVENGCIFFQSQTVYRRTVLYSQAKYIF